jgi:hypothetical protein
MGPDDILAALILCLAMFRRLELKAAKAVTEQGMSEQSEAWRAHMIRNYELVAKFTVLKIVVTYGWRELAVALSIPAPWYYIVPASVVVLWIAVLVLAFRRTLLGRRVQRQLGIVLQSPQAR